MNIKQDTSIIEDRIPLDEVNISLILVFEIILSWSKTKNIPKDESQIPI